MLLRPARLAVTNTFALLRLLPTSDRDKDIEILALRHRLPVLRRRVDRPGCFTGYDIKARGEDGFLGFADARLNYVTPDELPRADLELGRVYADCARPVETVREPARLGLRERFLAEHDDEIRELCETLVPSLRQAEKQHGPDLAFPAPRTRLTAVLPLASALAVVGLGPAAAPAAAATVPVGPGSYSDTRPPGTSGPTTNTGTPVTPKLTAAAQNRPVPTNDWWSSLAFHRYGDNPYSAPML